MGDFRPIFEQNDTNPELSSGPSSFIESQLNSLLAAKIVRDNFEKIDLNANGFVSEEELLQSLSTDFGSPEYKSCNAVRETIDKIEILNDDEWGWEHRGASKADLDKIMSLPKAHPVRRALDRVAGASSTSMVDLTNANGKIIAAANSIREATKKDNLIDTGTDENKICTTLDSLSSSEREKLKSFYSKRYHQDLQKELTSEMSGSQLDRAINLLNRSDDTSDDAGFVHELLLERHEFGGRTKASIAKALRDKLSSMTSAEISEADAQYQERYHTDLKTALLESGRFDKGTNESFAIHLRGSDQLTNDDMLKLASIALDSSSIEMFQEAMRTATPEARELFMLYGGERRLTKAFGGTWMNVIPNLIPIVRGGNLTDTELNRAKDLAENGKYSVKSLIEANHTWLGDNEKAIETALKQMSNEDRARYVAGRNINLHPGEKTDGPLTGNESKALSFYKQVRSQIESAGNATERLMWEDQIEVKGGSLVTALGRHNGFLYDSHIDDVLRTIENISEPDWRRLKTDTQFQQSIENVMKTYLNQDGLLRATGLIEKMKETKSFSEVKEDGSRSVLEKIKDSQGRGFLALYTKSENIWQAIENMSPTEQDQYRMDAAFAIILESEIERNLGRGAELEIAKGLLDQVTRGETPKRSIVEHLAEYGTHWSVDARKVITEVQKEFRENHKLLERIQNPVSPEDEQFSHRFQDNLHKALGAKFNTYGKALLERGHLTFQEHLALCTGMTGLDEKGLLNALVDLPEEQRLQLLDPSRQDNFKALLTSDELKIAQNLLQQGKWLHEDRLRAWVVGVGNTKTEIMTMLSSMSQPDKERMSRLYSEKFAGNASADFLGKLSKAEQARGELLIESQNKHTGEYVSESIRKHSKSRDGIGKTMVDAIWDGTGFQADQALNDLISGAEAEGRSTDHLAPERALMVETLDNFQTSKETLADAVTDVGLATAAVAGSVFSGGTSLSLLAKTSIAGGIGALFKVAGKSAISGSDYSWTTGQIAADGSRGFAFGATAFIGPAQIAQALGVGTGLGAEASQAALGHITRMGGCLLQEGGKEAIEQGLTTMIRHAIVSGTMRLPAESVSALANQIAVKGNEEAVRMALQISLAQALKTQSTNTAAQILTEYGITAASGALGGGVSGATLGATEWDTEKTVAENLEHVGEKAVTSAALAALSATALKLSFKVAANELWSAPKNMSHADEYIVDHVDEVGNFSKRPVELKAVQTKAAMVVQTLEGPVEAEPGDWIMTGLKGEHWPIKPQAFADSYDTVPGVADMFRKRSMEILAVQIDEPMQIITNSGKIFNGKTDDWMVIGPKGDKWFVDNEIFKASYMPNQSTSQAARLKFEAPPSQMTQSFKVAPVSSGVVPVAANKAAPLRYVSKPAAGGDGVKPTAGADSAPGRIDFSPPKVVKITAPARTGKELLDFIKQDENYAFLALERLEHPDEIAEFIRYYHAEFPNVALPNLEHAVLNWELPASKEVWMSGIENLKRSLQKGIEKTAPSASKLSETLR